jgi:hypothetical protein
MLFGGIQGPVCCVLASTGAQFHLLLRGLRRKGLARRGGAGRGDIHASGTTYVALADAAKSDSASAGRAASFADDQCSVESWGGDTAGRCRPRIRSLRNCVEASEGYGSGDVRFVGMRTGSVGGGLERVHLGSISGSLRVDLIRECENRNDQQSKE